MQTRINESGRSMIEMLGVLAIIGVLSVGGIAGYSKAMAKYKTNQVVDQVSMIVTNIRTLYAQQMDYDGLNNITAVNMGVIPDEILNKKDSTLDATTHVYTKVNLRNGFQGDVFVGPAISRAAGTGAGALTSKNAFVVEFDGLSRDACVAIASSDWGSGSSSGFIGMAVKGAAQTETGVTTGVADDVTDLTVGCKGSTTSGTGAAASGDAFLACPNGTNTSLPMAVVTASSACACASGNTCSIVWKYY